MFPVRLAEKKPTAWNAAALSAPAIAASVQARRRSMSLLRAVPCRINMLEHHPQRNDTFIRRPLDGDQPNDGFSPLKAATRLGCGYQRRASPTCHPCAPPRAILN